MPVTNYIWDELSDNVLMETDENDALVANYTCEPSQFGEVLSQHRANNDQYYNFDGLGSTRELTGPSQTVSDSYTYSAFGETVASSGSSTNPFQWNGAVGYYTSEETDDVYVRRRTYNPAAARWLSRDPLGFVDGPNVYEYVGNFVPNFADPSGRWSFIVHRIRAANYDRNHKPDYFLAGQYQVTEANVNWENGEHLKYNNNANLNHNFAILVKVQWNINYTLMWRGRCLRCHESIGFDEWFLMRLHDMNTPDTYWEGANPSPYSVWRSNVDVHQIPFMGDDVMTLTSNLSISWGPMSRQSSPIIGKASYGLANFKGALGRQTADPKCNRAWSALGWGSYANVQYLPNASFASNSAIHKYQEKYKFGQNDLLPRQFRNCGCPGVNAPADDVTISNIQIPTSFDEEKLFPNAWDDAIDSIEPKS